MESVWNQDRGERLVTFIYVDNHNIKTKFSHLVCLLFLSLSVLPKQVEFSVLWYVMVKVTEFTLTYIDMKVNDLRSF